jgi:hypothetical protein
MTGDSGGAGVFALYTLILLYVLLVKKGHGGHVHINTLNVSMHAASSQRRLCAQKLPCTSNGCIRGHLVRSKMDL